MKKKIPTLLASLGLVLLASSCGNEDTIPTNNTNETTIKDVTTPSSSKEESTGIINRYEKLDGYNDVNSLKDDDLTKIYLNNMSSTGGVISDREYADFLSYKGTDQYKTVSNAKEFLDALSLAKYDYTNTWNSSTNKVDQTLNKEGSVHVIEITNDLELGYNSLTKSGITIPSNVTDFKFNSKTYGSNLFVDDDMLESGISQIEINNMYNLLIYSKNGSKIRHAGFKVNSCNNLVVRNLDFDEMWMWEDSSSENPSFTMGDYDVYGFAYFKINNSEGVWIDHCSFGKSYDGQIDIANPTYWTNMQGEYIRMPYKSTSKSSTHISFCDFDSHVKNSDGTYDTNNYIYKMMTKIEADYQLWKSNPSSYTVNDHKTCLYYRALREGGATFEDVMDAVAIPQKKGFLLGDTGNSGNVTYRFTTDTIYQADKNYYVYNGAKYVKAGVNVGGTISKESVYEQGPGNDWYINQNELVSFANCRFVNIEDRLPNLRGGICYIYNSFIDCSMYLSARKTISTHLGSHRTGSTIDNNSKWKLALVSQAGIVCFGASLYYSNCEIIGVETPIKNNNIKFSSYPDLKTYDYCGFKYEHVLFYSGTERTNTAYQLFNEGSSGLPVIDECCEKNFSYHNSEEKLPFIMDTYTDHFKERTLFSSNWIISIPVGTNNNIKDMFLLTDYNNI